MMRMNSDLKAQKRRIKKKTLLKIYQRFRSKEERRKWKKPRSFLTSMSFTYIRVECTLQGKRGSLTTFGASATTASTFRRPKKLKKKKKKVEGKEGKPGSLSQKSSGEGLPVGVAKISG